MKDVKDYIPHREPFLFVDEIIEISDKHIKTRKFISPDEPLFKGHFPNYPLMPGVLICEAFFQSCAIFIEHITPGIFEKYIPVIVRVNNVKFKRMVYPGSDIIIYGELVEKLSNAFYFKGKVMVDTQVVTTLESSCVLVDKHTGDT